MPEILPKIEKIINERKCLSFSQLWVELMETDVTLDFITVFTALNRLRDDGKVDYIPGTDTLGDVWYLIIEEKEG